jgi:hypothetical protein
MVSLMKRNLIFELHGGSDMLQNKKKEDVENRIFQTAGRNSDGSYRKMFLPGCGDWVRTGMFVLYDGGTKGGDVARIVSFHETDVVGEVRIGLKQCLCDNSSSILSTFCQRWALATSGPASTVKYLTVSMHKHYELELYPMQNDFLNIETHFYSCPLMAIA